MARDWRAQVPRRKRFKRSTKESKPVNWKTDKRGTVRIRISLADPDDSRGFLPGNLTKQISIADVKVSEIVERLEWALLEG
jgi:hypothetical protein